ncbi:hypothetical protein WJT74_11025 [Sphingomicrobium sp. XHP0239]|uniref:hypothetical protein n=1 Tax=Sphingomicrobium maritimum TaxID=3133972 RepID=UPI0031CCD47E
MSEPIKQHDLAVAERVAAPHLKSNLRPDIEDRNFGLPVAIHATYFGLFLAYLGVMFVGFYEPQMILPMAIFVIFTVGFYVVPMLWTGMKPGNDSRALRMDELMAHGIATHTGLCKGRDALVQALILPVLILGWGIAVVSIAAIV